MVLRGPQINVSRDSLSLEYKESWLGDNPEVARQSENSRRCCAGVSGWSAQRTGYVRRLIYSSPCGQAPRGRAV